MGLSDAQGGAGTNLEQGLPFFVHLCSRAHRLSSHGISVLKTTEAAEPFPHHGLYLCTQVLVRPPKALSEAMF